MPAAGYFVLSWVLLLFGCALALMTLNTRLLNEKVPLPPTTARWLYRLAVCYLCGALFCVPFSFGAFVACLLRLLFG